MDWLQLSFLSQLDYRIKFSSRNLVPAEKQKFLYLLNTSKMFTKIERVER